MLSLGEKFVLSQPYHISPIALLLLHKYTPIMLRYAAVKMDHLDYWFRPSVHTIEPVHGSRVSSMDQSGLLVYQTSPDH